MPRLAPHPDIASQNLGATTVLVHLQTNRAFELSQTGGRCWELLREGCDRSAIKQRLSEEFDTSQADLDQELDSIFKLFVAEKILIEKPAE